ncbi:MAG: glycosyltransferase [Chitinophagaceae bacterium]|nr:glycosyltransferase [Chitinophagaceae bacterium]
MLSELNSMFPQHVNVVNLEKKSGKAEAVRIGMLESVKNKEYTHHGYIDADLAVSPEELYRLYEVMKSFRYKFIFGSRIKKIGTSIKRNEWRHFTAVLLLL